MLAALLCVLAMAAAACSDSAGRGSAGRGSAGAGPGRYETLDGGAASLAELQGTPVVVNFFASWCTPCRLEMPDFERVHAKLGDQVHFVGLNLQEDAGRAKNVVADTKVTYTIGLDRDGSIYRDFGGITMPTTVLLDAQGAVVTVHGGSIDGGSLTKLLAEKLGVA
jgi:thiol-disulfide isomerase/thioredoxin